MYFSINIKKNKSLTHNCITNIPTHLGYTAQPKYVGI